MVQLRKQKNYGGSKIMGMAASEARFLSLTGRKSNVEFQGQQINQQRTTLSNESAAYNQQLLTIQVPTAPSSDSFTKTVYSFTDSANNTSTITDLIPELGADGSAKGTYSVAYKSTTTKPGTITGQTSFVSTTTGTGASAVTSYTTIGGQPLTKVGGDSDKNLDTARLQSLYGSDYSASAAYYKFTTSDGTTSTTNYIDEASLQKVTDGTDKGNLALYKHMGDVTSTDVLTIKNCTLGTTASGRISSITSPNLNNGNAVALNASTTTDTSAYDNAMNEYNYKKEAYNKQMNDINAKLSIVQQQDKNLELQLKNLDTEQNAISTEMDAVKKVISKNVESSFKTFNA
jgi:hypothetical protein